jgi:site-specific DNA recombinase
VTGKSGLSLVGSKGYAVAGVFRDNLTGGESRRPGLRDMIARVSHAKKNRYRILFDHLDRWTRDVYLHADLRRIIDKTTATLEAPGMVLDGSSSPRLMENGRVYGLQSDQQCRTDGPPDEVPAAERLRRIRRAGGYRYGRVPGLNGKVLVRQEPQASIVVDALERFAGRTLESQADVQNGKSVLTILGLRCISRWC